MNRLVALLLALSLAGCIVFDKKSEGVTFHQFAAQVVAPTSSRPLVFVPGPLYPVPSDAPRSSSSPRVARFNWMIRTAGRPRSIGWSPRRWPDTSPDSRAPRPSCRPPSPHI